MRTAAWIGVAAAMLGAAATGALGAWLSEQDRAGTDTATAVVCLNIVVLTIVTTCLILVGTS